MPVGHSALGSITKVKMMLWEEELIDYVWIASLNWHLGENLKKGKDLTSGRR
jgi:hypothetical protein